MTISSNGSVARLLTRIPGARRLWRKFPVGSVPLRTACDIWELPAYAYGVFSAARLAQEIGLPGITVIEFGVAGGNGLVALEGISAKISAYLGLPISVCGFDTGVGMPTPSDYYDLPHVWQRGFYAMDIPRLRGRLKHASLELGNVAETVPPFLCRESLLPIGFISFDLDYYSSTKAAFQIFGGPPQTRLPRVFSYFDEVFWPEKAYHNDWVGELRAIREFNEENTYQKIAKIPHLGWMRYHAAAWNEQMYVHHDFHHPLYGKLVGPSGANSQHPLR